MFINADAFASLQIIHTEFHPNGQTNSQHHTSAGTKENLSVFGLFRQLACTRQGKAKLRQVFLRPTTDLGVISERQEAISTFLRPENEETVAFLRRSLRGLQDIKRLLRRMEQGAQDIISSGPTDSGIWKVLHRFTLHAVMLREGLERIHCRPRVGIIRRVSSYLTLYR